MIDMQLSTGSQRHSNFIKVLKKIISKYVEKVHLNQELTETIIFRVKKIFLKYERKCYNIMIKV